MDSRGSDWYRERRKRRTTRAYRLPSEALTDRTKSGAAKPAATRHSKRRRSTETQQIGLSHVAFLLAGIVMGAGFYALGGLFVRLGGYDRPVAPSPQPVPAAASLPATPPPPPPHPIVSSDPTAIVKAMLRASYAGRVHEAYAYWGVKPEQRAFFGAGGMYATLAEMTRQAAAAGSQADLSQFSFEVRKKSRGAATVGQLRRDVLVREYALTRHGNTWQIMACTEP